MTGIGFSPTTMGAGGNWPVSEADHTAAQRANSWQATASADVLASGVRLALSDGQRRVRLRSGDRLQIALPGGQRLSAQVLDRTGGFARVACQDGMMLRLKDGAQTAGSVGSSVAGRQLGETWTVT